MEAGEFKYIVRIADTDLDGNRSVEYALTKIHGIGIRTAIVLADLAEVDRTMKIGNLPDDKIEKLEQLTRNLGTHVPPWLVNHRFDMYTGENNHLIGAEVKLNLREDINLLKKIRCYKGIRHEQGQKVRGQRTKSNGRTGLTLGVMRKAVAAKKKTVTETKGKEKGKKKGSKK